MLWASEPGRWREEAKDDKVFFEDVDAGKQLRIIETTATVRVQNSCSTEIRFYELF